MINTQSSLMANAQAAGTAYMQHMNKIFSKLTPAEQKKYGDALKNGTIAIEDFAGDAGEKTLGILQEYREYAGKYASANQTEEEAKREITNLQMQKFELAFDSSDIYEAIKLIYSPSLLSVTK